MTDSSKSALSLISTHQGYSESEQRIVDYWSTSPRRHASRPLSFARAATSEATVSRFCRKLGFGSFRSFQFSLARDLESQRNEGLTDEVSLDNMEQSLKNILAAKVSELMRPSTVSTTIRWRLLCMPLSMQGLLSLRLWAIRTRSRSMRRLSFRSWACAAWRAPLARHQSALRSRCARVTLSCSSQTLANRAD